MSHPEIHPAVHSVGTGVGESLEDMVRRVQAMADAKFAEIHRGLEEERMAAAKLGKSVAKVRGYARASAKVSETAAKKRAAKAEEAKSKTAY